MTDRATLLMMPDGDTPTDADFAAGDVFDSYEEAIRGAHARVAPSEPLVPWIKFGGAILDPAHVMAINTPPATTRASNAPTDENLDDDLKGTFPASDPPARTQP